ncbi:hypothetical protein [Peribacillus alkalitolerans]|uniref:hypothetical protein n=1 Tax=Peribacillus alkalitolerans TaxID=1550385 RepID=UPI0013D41120|nr:hypothetical protein [Peribacillus alkalitolerans]
MPVEATSPNYPYDQEGWFESTQDYYCRMSKYGFKPTDPKYLYIIEQGKCAFVEGSTTQRGFQKEYADYKSSTSPY